MVDVRVEKLGKTKMIKTSKKHLDNLFKLSMGEHSLLEVLKMAGVKTTRFEACPDCGSTNIVWKREARDGGYSELVGYCECGACIIEK